MVRLSDDIDDNVGHTQYDFDDDFVGEVLQWCQF